MNCREAADRLYEFLDRELTPEDERQVRAHLADCQPCGEHFDVEDAFLRFVRARCRAKGAPPDLRRRILDEILDE